MAYSTQWANYIEDGLVNKAIAKWHGERPERVQDCATPSSLTDCPRMVWLKYRKNVPAPIPLGWGKAQRMLHGRAFEAVIAPQLKASGNLLHWWKDEVEGDSDKFEMGEGDSKIAGTPDLLLQDDGVIYISDAKTSMGKSFGYVPLKAEEAFKDYLWYKYKLQVECYYLLCHKNPQWFKDKGLLLPEACHLFSYALDDGVTRREFKWKPTKETAETIFKYAKRWNDAYNSETMPKCTCDEFDGTPRKFCYYVTRQEATKTGYKLGVECCGEDLWTPKS